MSSPAAAQIGAAVSVFSDVRFRGYSLSGRKPAAFLDLSYDDPGGIYASASASAVASSKDGLEPLGLQLNAGYARRLRSGITVDAGVVHANYARYSTGGHANSYTEVYAGVTRGILSSRIYFSPHYFEQGVWTLYGELDGNVSPARKLRLTGHVGILVPVRTGSDRDSSRAQVDWRLGLAREVGPVSLEVAWTHAGHDRAAYRARGGNALIFGLSWGL
jgi:uncharacterized protein (TIGR02001 family)